MSRNPGEGEAAAAATHPAPDMSCLKSLSEARMLVKAAQAQNTAAQDAIFHRMVEASTPRTVAPRQRRSVVASPPSAAAAGFLSSSAPSVPGFLYGCTTPPTRGSPPSGGSFCGMALDEPVPRLAAAAALWEFLEMGSVCCISYRLGSESRCY